MSPAAPIRTIDDTAAAAADLLRGWVGRTAPGDAARWLDAEIDRQRNAVDERRLGMALGLVGRRIGRAHLSLSADDLVAAKVLHPRWRPDIWGTDDAARVALLLATWTGDEAAFAARVDRLCATGELTEHAACMKGFAVFPAPVSLLTRARTAVRSSMQPLFEELRATIRTRPTASTKRSTIRWSSNAYFPVCRSGQSSASMSGAMTSSCA
jgi:hypothetical protein